MFNRTEIHEHRGPSRIDHHEYRAPTDESVKLLKELEEKAQAKVIQALRLEDIGNGDAVIQLERRMDTGEFVYKVFFKINGKPNDVEHRLTDYGKPDITEVFKELRSKMAEKIASEMLLEPFTKGMNLWR